MTLDKLLTALILVSSLKGGIIILLTSKIAVRIKWELIDGKQFEQCLENSVATNNISDPSED